MGVSRLVGCYLVTLVSVARFNVALHRLYISACKLAISAYTLYIRGCITPIARSHACMRQFLMSHNIHSTTLKYNMALLSLIILTRYDVDTIKMYGVIFNIPFLSAF